MQDIAVRHFQQRARAYLRTTGRFDEDVLSEMVCEYLATGAPAGRDMDLLYLHALDRVRPRVTVNGKRTRSPEVPMELPRDAAGSPPPVVMQVPFASGSVRAMLLLRLVYGFREEEIGQLFGLTESRISQLFGEGKAEVLAGLRPEQDVEFDVPVLEVEWLSL